MIRTTRMRRTTRTREDGFTLIEVMISVLLTAIAVIGIMALYMSQTRASAYSRHATEATVLAADKLEQLRTLSSTGMAGSADSGLDSLGASGGIFSRTWAVTTGTEYIDLRVTVTWDEDGTSKSVIVNGRRGL